MAEDNSEYCKRILQDLIKIPSYKEEMFPEIQKYILEELKNLGLEPEIDKDSAAIIARRVVHESAKTILLSAHYDTVPPTSAWTSDPFKPEFKKGKIYGLGSSDCKCGIVSILSAVKEADSKNNILIVITGHEDVKKVIKGKEFLGSDLVTKKRKDLKADIGLVTEASVRDGEFLFINGMFGKIGFTVTSQGKQTHACHPEKGSNAIYKAVDVITKLKDEMPLDTFAVKDRDYKEVFNVGKIEGGTSSNIVPHECRMKMEYRFSPNRKIESAKKVIEENLSKIEDVKWFINLEYPSFFIEDDNIFLTVASKNLSYKVKTRVSRGGTDANTFNGVGIPTVVFGPGECDQIHQPDEYVELDKIVECAKIISEVLETVF